MINNKKGQTSEAMTWIVATLIIIVLLGISLYAASFLSKSKVVNYKTEERSQDIVMEESLFSYFLVQDSVLQKKIFENLEKMDREEKFYEDFNSKFQQIKFNLEKYEKIISRKQILPHFYYYHHYHQSQFIYCRTLCQRCR